MKTLVTCNSRMEAEIIVSKLEAHGIKAIISADDMAGYRPSLTLLSGVKVLVSEKDLSTAQEVIGSKE